MKILIISDAWHPQINGVVRTLEMTVKELAELGHETRIVGPDGSKSFTFAMPFYPEIRLEFLAHRRLWRVLREFQPDFIHITTEGPLGWAARRVCLHRNLSFSTAYHTRFPEYLAARTPRVPG
jgi:glycosyltransferase involved in cell wall biosynthesis